MRQQLNPNTGASPSGGTPVAVQMCAACKRPVATTPNARLLARSLARTLSGGSSNSIDDSVDEDAPVILDSCGHTVCKPCLVSTIKTAASSTSPTEDQGAGKEADGREKKNGRVASPLRCPVAGCAATVETGPELLAQALPIDPATLTRFLDLTLAEYRHTRFSARESLDLCIICRTETTV